MIKKRVHYLIWWKNDLKKNATFESRTNLVKDGFTKEIKAFEEMKL